jgi:hypothetical protein
VVRKHAGVDPERHAIVTGGKALRRIQKWFQFGCRAGFSRAALQIVRFGLKDTVSRIWITRSTVRCGQHALTLTSPSKKCGLALATRRASLYSYEVIRVSGFESINTYT